jgi:hypothetical protein
MQEVAKRDLSRSRRPGLARLGVLVAAIVAVVIVVANLGGGSSSGTGSPASKTSTGRPAPWPAPPKRLVARLAPRRLPAALSGEAAVDRGDSVLAIGGLDSGLVSTAGVTEIASGGRRIVSAGSLAAPLHDAAAASVAGRTLVFGGGAATTIDAVEELAPGGTARAIGHLPTARSDLSAVTIGPRAYVLGGYDGTSPVASVLATSDGRRFTEIARLPTPVRYAAVAALGRRIYAFGGELADGTDSNAIQAVDVHSHRARLIGRLPTPLSHASAVVLGGRIFVLGGRVAGAASDRILSFDPGRARLEPAGRLPAAVTNAAAASAGGTGYLIGGLRASGAARDSIVTVRPVGTPRSPR